MQRRVGDVTREPARQLAETAMTATAAAGLTRQRRARSAPPGAVDAQERARQDALALVEREALVRPSFGFRILPVRRTHGDTFEADGLALEVRGLRDESGDLVAVAAATCTLGPALEARVTSLFPAGRPLLALALDAVGTERLFGAADHVVARIRREARRLGLTTGAEIGPGDPGMALDQQAALLALAGARQNGITLTARGMLAPVKSLSFLVTLGRNLTVRSAPRCHACPSKHRCSIRAHPAE